MVIDQRRKVNFATSFSSNGMKNAQKGTQVKMKPTKLIMLRKRDAD